MSALSLALLEPGTKANINLQIEIMIQKMLGKAVAPELSVTFVSTANEEIQPPYVH